MHNDWNRRSFLRILGITVGGTALGITSWSCSGDDDPSGQAADALTGAEFDKLAALAITMFEPEDTRERSALDGMIRWWAKGRTTRGPHLQLYRDGLSAQPSAAAAEAMRGEILEGIYSSSPGWRSLGYSTWPGVPSEPLEYATPPHDAGRIASIIPLAEIHG